MAVFWVIAPCSLVEVYDGGRKQRRKTSTRVTRNDNLEDSLLQKLVCWATPVNEFVFQNVTPIISYKAFT
jgi:hypothetical protein